MTYIQRGNMTVNQARMMNTFSGTSGGMGIGDRGSYQSVPSYTGNPYDYSNYIDRWRQYTHLYEICWEARKIIRIPIEDALRKPWVAEDIPEEIAKAITNRLSLLNFHSVLSRSLMLERLYGGCLTFMGIEEDEDNVKKPYHPRKGGRLRFLNSIPVSRISRMVWDSNPLSEYYMRPNKYIINGEELDVSRCLVWDGEPLFDPYDFALTNFRANLAGFGPSKLAPIWDDIVRAVGTRQAAYQMIQTNNSLIMAVKELQSLGGTTSGKEQIKALKEIANNLSLYRAAIIQKEKVDITQSAASFGSVPELVLTFIQVLSAASDIPATRFIGQAPGGLNATGESDLENYYNMIDSLQRNRIEPSLRRVYDIIGYERFPKAWDKEREKLTFKFPPLWNQSELEEAETAAKNLDNAIKARDAGLIGDEKVIEELNAKGVFTVELDDTDITIIDPFDSDPMGGGQPPFGGGGKEPSQGTPQPRGEAFGLKADPNIGGEKKEPKNEGTDAQVKNTYFRRLRNAKVPIPPIPLPMAQQVLVQLGEEDNFTPEQLARGVNVEVEHWDVTGGDLIETAKIAIAHLKERPDYYEMLSMHVENKDAFKEEKHPRANDGKFGSGGGEKKEVDKKPKKTAEEKDKEKQESFEKAIAHHSDADREAHREARKQGINIPPAWSNVSIVKDQYGEPQAKGRDKKGRAVQTRSVTATEKADAEKFERLKKFSAAHKGIMENVSKDFGAKPEAQVLHLINTTGFRLGSDKDTKSEKQAFGASTLMAEHAKVEGDKITFTFTGKKGVAQNHIVTDQKLAQAISEKSEGKLFDTTPEKVRDYLHSIGGKGFKVKDFRTYVATQEAIRAVREVIPPKPGAEQEVNKIIMMISKKVSQKLGNTPEMARDSYIDPEVFKKIRGEK